MRSLTLYTRDRSSAFYLDGRSGALLTDIKGLGESISLAEFDGSRSRSLMYPERHVFDDIEMTINFGAHTAAGGDSVYLPYTAYRDMCIFLESSLQSGMILRYDPGESGLSYRDAIVYLKSKPKSQRDRESARTIMETFILSRATAWFIPTIKSLTAENGQTGISIRDRVSIAVSNDSDFDMQALARVRDGFDPLVIAAVSAYNASLYENGILSMAFYPNNGVAVQPSRSFLNEDSYIDIDSDNNVIEGDAVEYRQNYSGQTPYRYVQSGSKYSMIKRGGNIHGFYIPRGAFLYIPKGDWVVAAIDLYPGVSTKTEYGNTRTVGSGDTSYRYWYLSYGGGTYSWTGANSSPSSGMSLTLTKGHLYVILAIVSTGSSAYSGSLSMSLSTSYTGGGSSGRISSISSMPYFAGVAVNLTPYTASTISVIPYLSLSSGLSSGFVIQKMVVIDFSPDDLTLYNLSAASLASLADSESRDSLIRRAATDYMSGELHVSHIEIEIREEHLD